MLDSIISALPEHALPKWMLFVSAVSIFNSIQCYLGDLRLSQRVYSAKPQEVTNLSNRTFGTWTLMVAIVRAYAAFNLHDPTVFNIALSTYYLAGFHFVTEWLVFGTAKLGSGLAGPLVVASSTIYWMLKTKEAWIG